VRHLSNSELLGGKMAWMEIPKREPKYRHEIKPCLDALESALEFSHRSRALIRCIGFYRDQSLELERDVDWRRALYSGYASIASPSFDKSVGHSYPAGIADG
jgi:hypothetical protein